MKRIVLLIALIISMTVSFSSCQNDATVVRANLETAEQNFQVFRRVVFYNGITGEFILTIEGYLAIIVDGDGDLVVTVKTAEGQFMKHYLKVIFKPSVIIPTIEKR